MNTEFFNHSRVKIKVKDNDILHSEENANCFLRANKIPLLFIKRFGFWRFSNSSFVGESLGRSLKNFSYKDLYNFAKQELYYINKNKLYQ